MSDNVIALSSDDNRFWVIDYANRRVGICRRNETVRWEPMPHDFQDSEELAMSIFDWEKWWTHNYTRQGRHLVISEVWSPGPEDQLKRRPVVYLDQMHWRTLADLRLGDSSRIKRHNEIAAPNRLLEMSSDGLGVHSRNTRMLVRTASMPHASFFRFVSFVGLTAESQCVDHRRVEPVHSCAR